MSPPGTWQAEPREDIANNYRVSQDGLLRTDSLIV